MTADTSSLVRPWGGRISVGSLPVMPEMARAVRRSSSRICAIG